MVYSAMEQYDADLSELVTDEERHKRYQFVPLPDSMVPTTVFVGNLCEFVTEEMLSELFQQVSRSLRPPTCIARKLDTSSKKYGFVAFQTVTEAKAAIDRLSGRELNGRKIKVEPIVDKPGQNRVRVPGEMIEYVLGYIPNFHEIKSSRGDKHSVSTNRKRKGSGKPRISSFAHSTGEIVHHSPFAKRLHTSELKALERAMKKGYGMFFVFISVHLITFNFKMNSFRLS